MSTDDDNAPAELNRIDLNGPDLHERLVTVLELDRQEQLDITQQSLDFTIDISGTAAPFSGYLLGYGSSRKPSHLGHPPNIPAARGARCSACRWSDTTLLWSTTHTLPEAPEGQYVVVVRGVSLVEGERIWVNSYWCARPIEVLRNLYVAPDKRMKWMDVDPSELVNIMELPNTSFQALEGAAQVDEGMAEALELHRTLINSSPYPGGKRIRRDQFEAVEL